MTALNAASGSVLWRTSYPAPFKMDKAAAPHGPGPKSTPVYADGKLFSIGMSGIVTAFDAATGKQLWQKPGLPEQPLWTSHSFSPLVDRGRVVFHMGGNDKGMLSAFDVNTGEAKWVWSGDGPGYGSPMLYDFAGVRQIVTMTQQKFIGLDAATGSVLWERPYTTEYAQNIITPVRAGDMLIVSGFQNPVVSFRVTHRNNQWTTEQVWENADVSLYMSDAVVLGETLVGFSQRRSGQFFGLDARSGKTLWTSDPRQGTNAAIVRAGDFWFALKDDGELLVSRAIATAFEPLRRYTVANSATWAQPVISNNRVFVKDVSTLTLWTFN
jgi:outer membrane protein assembly factor BamB